jgi:hypothetical protein
VGVGLGLGLGLGLDGGVELVSYRVSVVEDGRVSVGGGGGGGNGGQTIEEEFRGGLEEKWDLGVKGVGSFEGVEGSIGKSEKVSGNANTEKAGRTLGGSIKGSLSDKKGSLLRDNDSALAGLKKSVPPTEKSVEDRKGGFKKKSFANNTFSNPVERPSSNKRNDSQPHYSASMHLNMNKLDLPHHKFGKNIKVTKY